MSDAAQLIDRLGLEPHPEGGWYKEAWRAPAAEGERAIATAIHFLLEAGQRSHWHRVDAHEIWLFHSGDPLALSLSETDAGPVRSVTLGSDLPAGQQVQHVIETGQWQTAEPLPGEYDFALVSCLVVPGFEFSGFQLAPPGWAPGSGA